MPDVLKLLETDHREAEDLFAKVKDNTGAARDQSFAKLAQELTIHTEAEERVVYPAMDQAGLREDVEEAEKEHAGVKALLAEMKDLDSSSSEFDTKLTKLEADVSHHVQEEESEVFPKFRQAVTSEELSSLGDQVQAAKEEAKARA
jgi:iron-sulfur cluster repair protein YtfE (RIC family)